MAKGHKTPGSGRKKGTGNKATSQRTADIKASGDTPLEFLIKGMQDGELGPLYRLDCAKAAAPYVPPRLTAETIKAELDATVTYITKVEGGL